MTDRNRQAGLRESADWRPPVTPRSPLESAASQQDSEVLPDPRSALAVVRPAELLRRPAANSCRGSPARATEGRKLHVHFSTTPARQESCHRSDRRRRPARGLDRDRPPAHRGGGVQPPGGTADPRRPGGRQHRRVRVLQPARTRTTSPSSPTGSPFEEPNGGPNFYPWADDAEYLINIDNDGDARRRPDLPLAVHHRGPARRRTPSCTTTARSPRWTTRTCCSGSPSPST